jgi:hydrogenase maturation protein HypF
MHTYHIHINGLVQGVGFRPFVCRMAAVYHVTGWVSNSNDGVHIECNASAETVIDFYSAIINNPPPNAMITHHHFEKIDSETFEGFTIRQSSKGEKPDLLLTPDIAICNDCRNELLAENNKRFQYPFTTCLQCGPRYSISTALPYDRENTTMHALQMCDSCLAEYNDITNRRHYSQTNSCKQCAVPMHFYSTEKCCLSSDATEISEFVIAELNRGSIIAVKGIGGYLLLCDATCETSINTLRMRKQRPAKPFALLYANIEMAAADVQLRSFEIRALQGKSAPIVLCELKSYAATGICKEAIAPGLYKVGLMLPCSPLLLLIADAFGKPLIATSGNISGSPIIFKDADALENLFEIADYVLTYDRDIVAPQDDSVIQFTDRGQKIILRRSRGLAPNYFPNPFQSINGSALAMGAELKSAFALLDQNNLYISQYLGDQGTIESQTCFKETLQHIKTLVKSTPEYILVDKHPGYFVSQYGKEIAAAAEISITAVQHHKAHFGAVLAENNLLESKEPILGFTWDGTGFGDDGQIWGSEVFMYENKTMKRVAHLDYFAQLLGDKMSKEPRLSALSLLKNRPDKQFLIQKYFSTPAWQYYQQLIKQPVSIQTSSMGRFLDGIAAILGIRLYNTYEGEAAMQLESMARNCSYKPSEFYALPLINDRLEWNNFLSGLLEDIDQKKDSCTIAWKVFFSLAKMISDLSNHFNVEKIAFSGGVFQNALLVDILIERLSYKKKLYFHQQLSPNDECIGFGQLACFNIVNKTENGIITMKDKIALQQFQFPN